MRSNYLIIQPFGATVIDGNTGKIDFVNDVATLIAKGLIQEQEIQEIAKSICDNYDVSEDEVLEDINEFVSAAPHLHNGRDWIIEGNENYLSIVQADLELTLTCNLQCEYCFAEAGPNAGKENNEITIKEWMKICDWLLERGLKQATITGGDPVLSKAFWPVFNHLVDNGVILQIFTNGYKVDGEFISRISNKPINFVQISLDSTIPETHERYRGKGSFEKAYHAIVLLTKHKIPVVIGASIFQDTVNEIEKLAEFALSVGAHLRCSPIEARGRGILIDESLTQSAELRALVHYSFMEATNQYPDVLIDIQEQEPKIDEELHCKFFCGLVTIGSDGIMKPCLQSKGFFVEAAPWALEHRKTWEIKDITDHIAYSTVATINEISPKQELLWVVS